MANNKIKEIIESTKHDDKKKILLKDLQDNKFFKLLPTLSDEEKSCIDEMLLICIDSHDVELLRYLAVPVLEKKRFIDWKKKSDLISCMVDRIINGCHKDESVRFSDFVEKFMEMLSSQQLTKQHSSHVFKLVMLSFGGVFDPELFNIHLVALHAIKIFPWEEESDKLIETMRVLQSTIKKYFDCDADATLATNIFLFFINAFYLDKNNGKNQKLVLKEATEIFEFCVKQDWQCSDKPNKNNLSFKVLQSILEHFIQNMGVTRVELMKPMYATMLTLRECGEEVIESQINRLLADVADESSLIGDDTSVLLLSFLDGKMDSMAHKLKDMYLNKPEPFHDLMDRFCEKFLESNDTSVSNLLLFFTEVARKEPEKLPEAVPQHVTKYLTHQWYFSLSLMFFDALATSKPGDVVKYEDDVIRIARRNENAAALVSNLLPKIAVDDVRRQRYISFMAEKCRTNPSSMMTSSYVNCMRLIGSNDNKLLARHKQLFQDLMAVNPSAKDICKATINVIEGKSLEKVAEDFLEAKQDMNKLHEKVESMDNNVDVLKHDVDNTKTKIDSLQQEFNENSSKIEQLEEVVVETKIKVDEIDHKTLSHAPAWSVEVSKMLNVAGERDWRLFARRLGYDNDDVINWATQSNPCMSVLDDWFASHGTRSASHGVLKILDDMERKDAYEVVEEAIKDAEFMVGDDEEEDEKAPPPSIFLSYQWAHQEEVKLLKKHLTWSGYPTWMDIGQMGGGDKLYAKIDEGMRASKVVVCCVTERYAESPNCNREVNLAVTLGKSIIPLVMEKMEWPPRGSMGPIFGEYLFVRFYKRSNEGEGDSFWPPAMFQQLIMQIRYSVAPLPDLIPEDSPYKNWWNPPEEIIQIKKKDPQKINIGSNVIGQEDENHSTESPQVFISYQWDKQKEIKELFKKLTSRNIRCWLDIDMMGGGDSLFDKIDKGIRGSKVVLSCVTKKYALSMNCRREVALSDAIKKPLIPLLLEEGAWPPEGPMGLIMTQLLYIDFSQSEKGSHPWDDELKFNELLEQIVFQIVRGGQDRNSTKISSTNSNLGGQQPVAIKLSANHISKSKQPINKLPTSTSSLSSNRKLSSSSSSSSSSGAAAKTKKKVLNIFKSKSSK